MSTQLAKDVIEAIRKVRAVGPVPDQMLICRGGKWWHLRKGKKPILLK